MTGAIQTDDELLRRALFVPAETKEHLHAWIMHYLHLDIPDTKVDPESTSTPMDLIWEIYDAGRRNHRVDFAEILGYASRDSFKTLGAAVLEVLAVFHLQRDVAHMAAIEAQAKKSQSYVRDFFAKPFLRDYVVLQNEKRREIARYHDARTDESLTLDQFKALPVELRAKYREIRNYINIVICTLAGANSEHVPFFVVDEVDVVRDPKAYEEAKYIPAPRGDQLPMTLYTSTRKFSFGLVQKEIDRAEESGLHIRHWNIIDVTQRCPASRHRPDLPIIDVYYSRDDLKTITPEAYETLGPDKKESYQPDKAFSGCMSNCKLFAMCRGRLATVQKEANPDAKVKSLLKPVSHTQNLFKKASRESAKAQLMCWKPSTEGLIYPNFDQTVHMITAAEMAEKITGEDYPENYTKEQLVALLKSREVRFVAGMDFGYTHNFSVVLGAIDGNRCFILDVLSQAELEVEQQVELCDATIKHYRPRIFADPENPQAIVTFHRKHYRIKKVDKGPGSVIGGIELVRQLLRPGLDAPPRMYLLKGDEGCALLAKRLSVYHWKLDAKGDPSDVPDETDDDEADAMRYLIMSVFGKRGRLQAARETEVRPDAPTPDAPLPQNWMQQEIAKKVGEAGGAGAGSAARGKKGGFMWDLS